MSQTSTTTTLPSLYTVADLCALLQRSAASIYRDIAIGRVPAGIMLGGRSRRWVRAHIEAWVAAGCPDAREWEARRAAQ